MKRLLSNGIVFVIILMTGMVACERNKTGNTTQTEKVRKLLELEARMNALNSGTGKMTNFMSVIGYSQLKDGQLTIDSAGSQPGSTDSIKIDTANYWQPVTCAKVSESDNPDGTHTTIYDYGDGCDEFGSMIRGKITYIWKNESNSSNYYSKVIYENYYSYGSLMNGFSEYTFTSDGNSYYSAGGVIVSPDSTVSTMPVFFNWSGTSTGHDEIIMVYDDGNSTTYKSDYSNVWDSISYKVLEGDYYYSNTIDGYEYHYQVSVPLVTSYKCTDVWVPVSGVETITTTEKGETTVYSLNYGNGTCDNLAELTQNGETSVVDFSQVYKVMEGGDSTIVPMVARNFKK
jgi:hypothetical protein